FKAVSYFSLSSRRRHTRSKRDWSSDVCSSDLEPDDEGTADHDDEAQRGQDPDDDGGDHEPPEVVQPEEVAQGGLVAVDLQEGAEIGRASCRERRKITRVAGLLREEKQAVRKND